MNMHDEQPVLILGAGLGGTALLDIFSLEENINIVGIVDINPDAMGIEVARNRGIRTFTDIEQALQASGRCMVFNLTNNPKIADVVARYVEIGSVIGGHEAMFLWKLVSQLQSVKCELQENEIRMQAVLNNVAEGIISATSDGIIEDANPATEAIFGYRPNELIGQPITLLMPAPHQEKHDSYISSYLRTGVKRMIGRSNEVIAIHKDGHQFPLEISIAEMEMSGSKHFVAIVRDITRRKTAEEKLTQLALYDSLTGLPNRTNFFERLEFSLSQARRHNRALALLFIDLDGFKEVNDRMGHATGDHLLKEMARRLQGCIRESDNAARMGGDEFTVILNNLPNTGEVTQLAEKIIRALNQPVDYGGKSCCQVGASVGIAIYPDHGQLTDDLIRVADSAMYRAKAAGKNTYKVG